MSDDAPKERDTKVPDQVLLEDVNKFHKLIKGSSACPVCLADRWALMNRTDAGSMAPWATADGEMLMGPGVPITTLFCTTCGYRRDFHTEFMAAFIAKGRESNG